MTPELFNFAVEIVKTVILEDIEEEKRARKRKVWTKQWIKRRGELGASATLLKELREEDPLSYRNMFRLDASKFEELLSAIEADIQKMNTTMRMAIPARVKLEITLRFLASGDSYHSLAYFFCVPVSSISKFLPDVLVAITNALSSHIKVSAKNYTQMIYFRR